MVKRFGIKKINIIFLVNAKTFNQGVATAAEADIYWVLRLKIKSPKSYYNRRIYTGCSGRIKWAIVPGLTIALKTTAV